MTENIKTGLNFFQKLRSMIVFLTKIIFCIFSFYYLWNFKSYKLTLLFPASLRSFSIINVPLTFIEKAGMFLFILPLTIVILSLLFPERKLLKIVAALFSIGGSLFSFFHMISHGIYQEYFKAGFFSIYHELSFKKKENLFEIALADKLDFYRNNTPKPSEFSIYMEKLTTRDWETYLQHLKTLKADEINSYAAKIASNIHTGFLKTLEKTNQILNSPTDSSWGWGSYLFLGIIVISIAGSILWMNHQINQTKQRLVETSQSVQEQAAVTKENSQIQEKTVKLNVEQQQTQQTLASQTKELAQRDENLQTQATELFHQLSQMKESNDYLASLSSHKIQEIETKFETLLTIVKDQNTMALTNFQGLNSLIKNIENQLSTIKHEYTHYLSSLPTPQVSNRGPLHSAENRIPENLNTKISQLETDLSSKASTDKTRELSNLIKEHSEKLNKHQEDIDKLEKESKNIVKLGYSNQKRRNEIEELKTKVETHTTQLDDLKAKELQIEQGIIKGEQAILKQTDILDKQTTTLNEINTNIFPFITETLEKALTKATNSIYDHIENLDKRLAKIELILHGNPNSNDEIAKAGLLNSFQQAFETMYGEGGLVAFTYQYHPETQIKSTLARAILPHLSPNKPEVDDHI